MTDWPFRLALLLILMAGVIASGAMRKRADRAGGVVPRSADEPWVGLALKVGGLTVYGSLLAWILYPPVIGWASVALPDALRWLGAALMVLGVATGLWALRHLGRNVTPTAVPRPDAELVTTGPYRWVRHPLYSSGLLTLPGAALLAANPLVLVAGAATYAVLLYRTRREETELVRRFGERYVDYRARTGMILPRVGRSGTAVS